MSFEEDRSFLPNGRATDKARTERLERAVFGTPERDYEDGMKHQLHEIRTVVEVLKKWGNRWGFILLGALAASGFIDGRAAKIIGQFMSGMQSP